MFQNTVTLYPAAGREGDFASNEPYHNVLPPQGGFRAGKKGVFQARFVWRDSDDESLINNSGSGVPLGFVMNEGRGTLPVNETGSLYCLPGTSLGVLSNVDAWVRTTTVAKAGQKIFAVLADGTIKTGAAGATVDGAVETNFVAASGGAANTLIKMTRFGA